MHLKSYFPCLRHDIYLSGNDDRVFRNIRQVCLISCSETIDNIRLPFLPVEGQAEKIIQNIILINDGMEIMFLERKHKLMY